MKTFNFIDFLREKGFSENLCYKNLKVTLANTFMAVQSVANISGRLFLHRVDMMIPKSRKQAEEFMVFVVGQVLCEDDQEGFTSLFDRYMSQKSVMGYIGGIWRPATGSKLIWENTQFIERSVQVAEKFLAPGAHDEIHVKEIAYKMFPIYDLNEAILNAMEKFNVEIRLTPKEKVK